MVYFVGSVGSVSFGWAHMAVLYRFNVKKMNQH
nr:MAG TPA: hypothetical protein [Caudoviricetes sp.]